MARIKNPEAYAAWLARKQMAQTQQQNVDAYSQGGVDEQTRQKLLAALAQQAAAKEAMAQQQGSTQSANEIFGSTDKSAATQIFKGKSMFEGDLFGGNLFKR
jgi:hypothetical protein